VSDNLTKILIIHTGGGIGDVLLSTGVIQALAEAYPQAQIDFLCQQRTSMALRSHPKLHRLHCWPAKGPGSLGAFARWVAQLRAQRYDAALVLWSTTATAWLTWLCGIPRRVGQDSRLSYSFLYNLPVRVRSEHGDVQSHWSEILLDYVRALGIPAGPAKICFPIPQEAQNRAEKLLEPLAHESGPLIGLHAFKGPPVDLQNWPLDVFAQWVQALREQLGAKIVLTGSPSEAPYAQKIAEIAGPERLISVAGQTDLETLAALSTRCQAFVCPDSGPMHVAAAAGARVLGVYALEEDFPARWAPLSSECRILRPQPTGCPPGCRKPTCRDFRCYRSVALEQLVAAVRELLP